MSKCAMCTGSHTSQLHCGSWCQRLRGWRRVQENVPCVLVHTRSSFTVVHGASVFVGGGESKKMCRVYWYTHVAASLWFLVPASLWVAESPRKCAVCIGTHTCSSFTVVLGASVFVGGGESKKMCRVYWYTHVAASLGFLVPASSWVAESPT
jgi:hypothetical protein